MIKLAVFDLDGTLLNTIDDIAASCNSALEHFGFPTHSVEEVKSLVGYGVKNLINGALPQDENIDEKQARELFDFYLEHYNKNMQNQTKLYDGIEKMLQTLKEKGVRIAILSNKLDKDTKEITEYYLPDYAEIVFGQREGIPLKPDPQALLEIIELLGVGKQETVYIGDSEADVKTAIAAGVRPIAVTWGFRSVEELEAAGATITVNNCDELIKEILRV